MFLFSFMQDFAVSKFSGQLQSYVYSAGTCNFPFGPLVYAVTQHWHWVPSSGICIRFWTKMSAGVTPLVWAILSTENLSYFTYNYSLTGGIDVTVLQKVL